MLNKAMCRRPRELYADEYYRNHVQPPEKPKELFALTKSQQEVVDFINQDGKTK